MRVTLLQLIVFSPVILLGIIWELTVTWFGVGRDLAKRTGL